MTTKICLTRLYTNVQMKKSEIQYFFVFIFVSKEEAYSLSSIFVCTLSAFRNIIHMFFFCREIRKRALRSCFSLIRCKHKRAEIHVCCYHHSGSSYFAIAIDLRSN